MEGGLQPSRLRLPSSAEIPEAALINHRDDHFFTRAVAIEEGKEGVPGMLCGVYIRTHDIHLADAAVLVLLLPDEHLRIGDELLTINSGDAVGLIVPVYKLLVLPLEQLIIIGLGRPGGNLVLRRCLLTGTEQTEAGYYK